MVLTFRHMYKIHTNAVWEMDSTANHRRLQDRIQQHRDTPNSSHDTDWTLKRHNNLHHSVEEYY